MKSLKKWKILNDSDRESQHSRQINKVDSTNAVIQSQEKQKSHSKAYVPLKRKKTNNSSTFLHNQKSIALSSQKQFLIPSLSHKYIRYDKNGSSLKNMNKLRTQNDNYDGMEIRLDSLEDIQQKGFGLGGLSQRAGSVQIRRSLDVNSKFLSQRQTQRTFFKQPSINKPVQQIIDSAFKKKQKSTAPNIQKIKQNIRQLGSQQKSIKTEILDNLQQYKDQMRKMQQKIDRKIEQQLLKDRSKKVIDGILEQYKQYKPKIDELESQKQVFLQALIRMAPV